jgi:FMN phosphatase YigB (HAD superfamily)
MDIQAEVAGFGGSEANKSSFRRGYYPKGRGEVMVRLVPMWAGKGMGTPARGAATGTGCIQPITLANQGRVVGVTGRVFVHRTSDPDGGTFSGTVSMHTAVGAVTSSGTLHDKQLTAVVVATKMTQMLAAGLAKVAAEKGRGKKSGEEADLEVDLKVDIEVEDTGGKKINRTRGGGRDIVTVGVLLMLRTSTGCVLASDMLENWDDGKVGDEKNPLGSEEMTELSRAASVATKCAESLLSQYACGACVDAHTADQLIIFMALADGNSSIVVPSAHLRQSQHMVTAVAVAEQLTGAKFKLEEQGGATKVSCLGVGYSAFGTNGSRQYANGAALQAHKIALVNDRADMTVIEPVEMIQANHSPSYIGLCAFDFDNTLRNRWLHRRWIEETNRKPTQGIWKAIHSMLDTHSIQQLKFVAKRGVDFFSKHSNEDGICPELFGSHKRWNLIRKLLDHLRSLNFLIVVITLNERNFVKMVVDKFLPKIHFVVAKESFCKNSTNKSVIIQRITDQFGIDPRNCMFVDDDSRQLIDAIPLGVTPQFVFESGIKYDEVRSIRSWAAQVTGKHEKTDEAELCLGNQSKVNLAAVTAAFYCVTDAVTTLFKLQRKCVDISGIIKDQFMRIQRDGNGNTKKRTMLGRLCHSPGSEDFKGLSDFLHSFDKEIGSESAVRNMLPLQLLCISPVLCKEMTGQQYSTFQPLLKEVRNMRNHWVHNGVSTSDSERRAFLGTALTITESLHVCSLGLLETSQKNKEGVVRKGEKRDFRNLVQYGIVVIASLRHTQSIYLRDKIEHFFFTRATTPNCLRPVSRSLITNALLREVRLALGRHVVQNLPGFVQRCMGLGEAKSWTSVPQSQMPIHELLLAEASGNKLPASNKLQDFHLYHFLEGQHVTLRL